MSSSNSMASSTTEATGNNQPSGATLYVSTIPPPFFPATGPGGIFKMEKSPHPRPGQGGPIH
jgi:hypothetical protein